MIKKAVHFLKSWTARAQHAFDVRDVFVFGGLALMGYGLYLLRPWLGYAAAGAMLMTIGMFAGRTGAK